MKDSDVTQKQAVQENVLNVPRQQLSQPARRHKLSCFNPRRRQAYSGPNATNQKLKNLDPTLPNPTKPMGQPNPWTTMGLV